MPPLPKRHHYVPELLVRNFRGTDNLIRFFDKRELAEGIVSRNPKKVLYEDHLYTRTAADGARDADCETAYAKLESDFAPALREALRAVRSHRLPRFTAEQKMTWDRFFYEQWRRVPDLHAALFTPGFFEELTKDAVAEFESTFRPASADERAWLSDPVAMNRLRQSALVSSLNTPSANVLSVLHSRGLAILRTRSATKSFILGSRPVVKMTPAETTNLADHRVEMWLPVAPDIAFGVGLDAADERIIEAPDSFVRSFNLAVLKQSSSVVSNSETLLRSLLRHR